MLVGQKSNDGWVLKVDQNGDVIWSKTYEGTNNNWDVWILKLNLSDGSIEFSKTYGGLNEEMLKSLMPKGNQVGVLAYTKSWGNGGEEFWFFEIDESENLLNSLTYGGNGDDSPYMGIKASDGGYIFVGSSQTASFSFGAMDYFVVKISRGGYSCIISSQPTPITATFNPSVNVTLEVPLPLVVQSSQLNFTQTSPNIDYNEVKVGRDLHKVLIR